MYALAASETYGLGGDDLDDDRGESRAAGIAVGLGGPRGGRPPAGPPAVCAASTRSGVHRLVADLRRFSTLAHGRPAGEVLYAFLRETGWLARYAGADDPASEEALQNVARFFDIVRAQSALLADDRCAFVARHLRTLIEAGDDPPTADLDSDSDAVAVLTVHQAKGLEFPTVFMLGLVDGRFPSGGRRDPLAIPTALLGEGPVDGNGHLREERRLFYVGLTRARDELILSHAADSAVGARVGSRRSCSRRSIWPGPRRSGSRGRPRRRRVERLAAFAPTEPPAAGPTRAERREPLTLSFGRSTTTSAVR